MAHPGDQSCCPHCGAQVRRNQVSTVCDPCQRTAPHLVVPAEFYDDPALSAALARLDFGPVFRRVRAETRRSQHVLGGLLEISQGAVSDIENGKRSLTDAATLIRSANVLGIPAGKLGFRHGVTVTIGDAARTGQEGSWMERRDFVERVAGLTLGLSGVIGLDLDRLIALLPDAEPTGTRHLGAADVTTIEQATKAFSNQDFATGSGPIRDLAAAQLRSVLPLLDAQMTPEVQPRLYLATARLATQAGWMSFMVNQDDAARRQWLIALTIARETDHPLATDQTVFVLYDLALQAVGLRRPVEALQLAQLGHTAAIGGHPVSAATMSCLTQAQAWAHAIQNDPVACDRALGQAVEHFTSIDPAQESFADFLDDTMLASQRGDAYYKLALASRDPQAAGQAVPLLRHAVEHFGPDYARPRATALMRLAGAHAIAGDADTAVSVGHQAVDAVTALHSPRTYDHLRILNTALEPLHTSPGVVELRERLSATAV